jgi:GNAT superfamily N-acetyltransferase
MARADDASEIADVWIRSFHATYTFPMAHSADEVHEHVRETLLPSTETWVAEEQDKVVGFMSIDATSVVQLYLDPDYTGRGIGSRLIAIAKEHGPAGLELWTFQVNEGARRFYERHGFTVAEMTEGAGNEEQQPDVRYIWRERAGRGEQQSDADERE